MHSTNVLKMFMMYKSFFWWGFYILLGIISNSLKIWIIWLLTSLFGMVEFSSESTLGSGTYFAVVKTLTALISFLIIYLFWWFILSWLNFDWPNVSRNLPTSKFSSLFEYRCPKYFLMFLWISLVFLLLSPFRPLILLIWIFSFPVSRLAKV
jgi:hypothetical protein